jgi:methionyl-tRNA formyltransferase
VRLAIFADKQVGLEISRFIIENFRADLTVLVTKGSGEISSLANTHGVLCLNSSVVAIEKKLQDLHLDLAILAWWPDIISLEIMNMAKYGFINTHPSLLPYNKGKHPNFWALIEGNPFGVSIHKVERRVDSGEIIAQREITYDWTDNAETLHMKATKAMLDLFRENYARIRSLDFQSAIQNPEAAGAHQTRDFQMKSRIELDEIVKARDLLNLLRAKTFSGFTGLIFEDEGTTYEATISIKKIDADQ